MGTEKEKNYSLFLNMVLCLMLSSRFGTGATRKLIKNNLENSIRQHVKWAFSAQTKVRQRKKNNNKTKQKNVCL